MLKTYGGSALSADMELRNRWGTGVDPVPFFVVVATAFAVCYSFGTVYLLAYDLSVSAALWGSTGAFAAAASGSYYRFVWTYRPEFREEVPVGIRFQRLLLASFAAVVLVGLLALPFFAR
jgi:hypothetical protein